MKIYLFRTKDGQHHFYSAPAHESEHPRAHHGGLRGWFEKKAVQWREAWTHSQHGLSARLRGVWEWLQRTTYADESLLVRLRTTPHVEIHHPGSLTDQEVRNLWADYLARRHRRHLPWLGLNALVSPLTVLLAPLPGPNIIGYWFAYRAIRHLLAVLGIRRIRRDEVPISVHPTETLEGPVDHESKSLKQALGHEHDGEDLREFLRRSGQPNIELKTEAAGKPTE